MDELSLAVVGIDHANTDRSRSNRRFELLQCVAGEPVELVPEPRNRHDPNAVAVFSVRGIQIGYLTAERAPFVGSRIRAGVEAVAIFQRLDRHTAAIRLRFGGGAPTLPPEKPALPPGDGGDFFADPDGPDWGA